MTTATSTAAPATHRFKVGLVDAPKGREFVTVLADDVADAVRAARYRIPGAHGTTWVHPVRPPHTNQEVA